MSDIYPSSLHLLLSARKWKDAEALLTTNPSLAFEVGSPFHVLPLVTALMNHAPLWIIDALIDANPTAVNTKNEYGMLPLRVAIRSKCDTDIVSTLIREEPDSVKCFGVSGKTCLHLACLYNKGEDKGSHELIDTLLQAWPEAAQWRDRDGWHPLHLACICEADTYTIQQLVDAYPNAAAMPDTPEHQLPLHIAAYHNASQDSMRIIYDAYPDAIKWPTKTKGFLPLHLVCCHKDARLDSVSFLLNKYPEGASVQGKDCKSLPLHLAARYGCPMECIQMLVDTYPSGLGEKNAFGETPFTDTYHEEENPQGDPGMGGDDTKKERTAGGGGGNGGVGSSPCYQHRGSMPACSFAAAAAHAANIYHVRK